MFFIESAYFLYNRNQDILVDDEIGDSFLKQFLKSFHQKESFFNDSKNQEYIKKLPTFLDYCKYRYRIPNNKAIVEYLEELNNIIEGVSLLNTSCSLQEPASVIRNISLSSDNFNFSVNDENYQLFKKLTEIERIDKIKFLTTEKKGFKKSSKVFLFPSEKKITDADLIWKNVARETKILNQTYRKTKPIREAIIYKMMSVYTEFKNNKKLCEWTLDYTMGMLQRHTTIIWSFRDYFLKERDFNYYRMRSIFEINTTKDTNLRRDEEDKLLSRTGVSSELLKKFQLNELARPRYAALSLPTFNNLPTTNRNNETCFAILNDEKILESTYTAGDTLIRTESKWRLSTALDFDVMFYELLHNVDCNNVKYGINTALSIINWALTGEEINFCYIEAHLPIIDLSNPSNVTQIFIPKNLLEIDKNIIQAFTEQGVTFDNTNKNPAIEASKLFFRLIEVNKKDDIPKIQQLIKTYPYLPKLRIRYPILYAKPDPTFGDRGFIRDQRKLRLEIIETLTSLEVAAKLGNLDILKILSPTLLGFDIVNIPAEENLTSCDKMMLGRIFYQACKVKNNPIGEFLLSRIPHIVNQEWICLAPTGLSWIEKPMTTSPLISAVREQNMEMFEYLLLNGANPYLQDSQGKTAIDYLQIEQCKHILNNYSKLEYQITQMGIGMVKKVIESLHKMQDPVIAQLIKNVSKSLSSFQKGIRFFIKEDPTITILSEDITHFLIQDSEFRISICSRNIEKVKYLIKFVSNDPIPSFKTTSGVQQK